MKAANYSRGSFETSIFTNVVLLYWIIFSIGLCKLSWITSRYIYQHLDFQPITTQMCEWTRVFFHPKIPELLFFCLSLISLFIFWGMYAVCTAVVLKQKTTVPEHKTFWILPYCFIAAVLNIGLLPQPKFLFLDVLIWTVGFCGLPIYIWSASFKRFLINFETRVALNNTVLSLISGCIVLVFLSVFYPLIGKPLQIASDFLDIPEQTILGHKVVDNTQYINAHHIAGLHLYDPRSSEFKQNLDLTHRTKQHHYSVEENEFIEKNRIELSNKVKAGWLFFHHSWVLNPVLASSLGAETSKQVFLYGYGSAQFLKHLLLHWGGINFQNYFKLSFAFYPLYFCMFLGVIYSVFRRIDFVCIGALLLSSSFFLLGYQMILLAPGYNPMRHVLDLPMIALFFYYFKYGHSSRQSIGLLLGLLGLGLGSIIWSKDFGLFLTLSLLLTVMIHDRVLQQSSFVPSILGVFGIISAIVLYRHPMHGVNYNFLYMLLGYTLPSTHIFKIIMIIMGISLAYIGYIQNKKIESPYFWLSLGLFFYLQMQFIYYILYPSLQHFLVLAPIFIVWGMTWLWLWHDERQAQILGSYLVLFGSLLFLYVPSLYFFYKESSNYSAIFANHIVHHWSLPSGQFQTTMEPAVFSESVQMIDHYLPHAKSMYLISKYDAILPVLAQRYNALPVVNLALDLLAQRDIDRCVQAITTHKPQYLFIDSDIRRDLDGDVMTPDDCLNVPRNYQESYGRFTVLKNMRSVYNRIQNDYVPIQQGPLLTVYARKAGT
jgi:hypothetical protein